MLRATGELYGSFPTSITDFNQNEESYDGNMTGTDLYTNTSGSPVHMKTEEEDSENTYRTDNFSDDGNISNGELYTNPSGSPVQIKTEGDDSGNTIRTDNFSAGYLPETSFSNLYDTISSSRCLELRNESTFEGKVPLVLKIKKKNIYLPESSSDGEDGSDYLRLSPNNHTKCKSKKASRRSVDSQNTSNSESNSHKSKKRRKSNHRHSKRICVKEEPSSELKASSPAPSRSATPSKRLNVNETPEARSSSTNLHKELCSLRAPYDFSRFKSNSRVTRSFLAKSQGNSTHTTPAQNIRKQPLRKAKSLKTKNKSFELIAHDDFPEIKIKKEFIENSPKRNSMSGLETRSPMIPFVALNGDHDHVFVKEEIEDRLIAAGTGTTDIDYNRCEVIDVPAYSSDSDKDVSENISVEEITPSKVVCINYPQEDNIISAYKQDDLFVNFQNYSYINSNNLIELKQEVESEEIEGVGEDSNNEEFDYCSNGKAEDYVNEVEEYSANEGAKDSCKEEPECSSNGEAGSYANEQVEYCINGDAVADDYANDEVEVFVNEVAECYVTEEPEDSVNGEVREIVNDALEKFCDFGTVQVQNVSDSRVVNLTFEDIIDISPEGSPSYSQIRTLYHDQSDLHSNDSSPNGKLILADNLNSQVIYVPDEPQFVEHVPQSDPLHLTETPNFKGFKDTYCHESLMKKCLFEAILNRTTSRVVTYGRDSYLLQVKMMRIDNIEDCNRDGLNCRGQSDPLPLNGSQSDVTNNNLRPLLKRFWKTVATQTDSELSSQLQKIVDTQTDNEICSQLQNTIPTQTDIEKSTKLLKNVATQTDDLNNGGSYTLPDVVPELCTTFKNEGLLTLSGLDKRERKAVKKFVEEIGYTYSQEVGRCDIHIVGDETFLQTAHYLAAILSRAFIVPKSWIADYYRNGKTLQNIMDYIVETPEGGPVRCLRNFPSPFQGTTIFSDIIDSLPQPDSYTKILCQLGGAVVIDSIDSIDSPAKNKGVPFPRIFIFTKEIQLTTDILSKLSRNSAVAVSVEWIFDSILYFKKLPICKYLPSSIVSTPQILMDTYHIPQELVLEVNGS